MRGEELQAGARVRAAAAPGRPYGLPSLFDSALSGSSSVAILTFPTLSELEKRLAPLNARIAELESRLETRASRFSADFVRSTKGFSSNTSWDAPRPDTSGRNRVRIKWP
jgi:hypothetical protein